MPKSAPRLRAFTVMCHLTTGIHSGKGVIGHFCPRVYFHNAVYYSLLHPLALWCNLLLLGYKPVYHVTAQNEIKSSTRENAIKRLGKHGMCEAAAGIAWHTVLQQTFVGRKSTF